MTVNADVVVGADGIHSAVRELLFGPESPHFSGSIAYRGLVPAERLAHLKMERNSSAWLGPDRHFVHYYVGAGRFVNFVGVVPGKDWRVESWSAKGEVADALAEFATWHPQVQQIIRLVCSPLNWTRALRIGYRLNRSNGNLRRAIYARCYHAKPEASC